MIPRLDITSTLQFRVLSRTVPLLLFTHPKLYHRYGCIFCTKQGTFPLLSEPWYKMADTLGRIAEVSEAEVGNVAECDAAPTTICP